MYETLRFACIFPGVPRVYASQVYVKASKTRRRGLSSSFPLANEKSLLRKTNEVVTANPRVLSRRFCSDESKGERLKALACPLRERLICECFTGISFVFIFNEYEDRLIQIGWMHRREIALIRAKLILSTRLYFPYDFPFLICYSYRVTLSKLR